MSDATAKMLLSTCVKAYNEMNGDYVDEVWWRDLGYLRKAIKDGAVQLGIVIDLQDRVTKGDEPRGPLESPYVTP